MVVLLVFYSIICIDRLLLQIRKMIGVNADCITSIYENGRSKVNSLFELLDENLLWLEEIQEEARKAFQR